MESKASKTRLLELEPNLVLLFSVIAVPVIILGALVILGTVRAEMNGLVGEQLLGGTAEDTARHLDTYLLNSLDTVSIVAASPTIRDAVRASNLSYEDTPEAIHTSLESVDEAWVASRGATELAVEIVGREASRHLDEISEVNPSYKELLVTDRFGALVAATNITTDYYQADESWWREAFGDGERGTLYLGEVRFDRSAGAYAIEIAVPIHEQIDENVTEVSGVLKALMGTDELFAVVGAVQRGESGHALLVSATDGSIIAGRDPSDTMKREYPALAQLRESLAQGSRSFVGRQGGELWLAGFSKMPQPTPASFADWVVVVQQLHDEINAPTRRATVSLALFVLGMVLLIVLFSLYLHYKLVKPIREIDLREEMDRLSASESAAGEAS